MSSISDQLAAAAKAHFEAQLALINALTNAAFKDAEKVIELNASTTKASLEGVSDAVKQIGTAKDPQELLSAATAKLQPTAEQALEYSHHLAEIAASMHAEFAQAAEMQVAETTRALAALIDEASREAPAGAEHMVAMMKALVNNANAGFEQLAKNAKQAVEALQTSMETATSQIAQAAEKTTQTARPAE